MRRRCGRLERTREIKPRDESRGNTSLLTITGPLLSKYFDSMAGSRHEISKNEDGRIEVRLEGSLTLDRVQAVAADLQQLLVDHEGPLALLFDLMEVRRCELKAREELVKIQRTLAARNFRTVYLADRPRIRGITLWVVHFSEDGNARIVVNQHEAEDWLQLDVERLEYVEARASALTLAAVRRRGKRRR